MVPAVDGPSPPADPPAVVGSLRETVETLGEPDEVAACLADLPTSDLSGDADATFARLVDCQFRPAFAWTTYRDDWRAAHREAFGDADTVAAFDDADVRTLLSREDLIANEQKIRAIVANAGTFVRLLDEHGSFRAYLDSFGTTDDAVRAVEERFRRVGPQTAREFLTGVGWAPVVRRSVSVGRTLARIGVVAAATDGDAVEGSIRAVADAAGCRPLELDRLCWMHAFGPHAVGMDGGVCAERPRCEDCLVAACSSRER